MNNIFENLIFFTSRKMSGNIENNFEEKTGKENKPKRKERKRKYTIFEKYYQANREKMKARTKEKTNL